MYYKVKEYDKAVIYLEKALEEEPTNKNIYTYLLESYSALEDSDSIYALLEKCPNDDLAKLFSAYIVLPPEFSEAGGEYEDELYLELTTDGNNQIFYTLNGKNPTISGKLFSKPIKLTEGTTEVKAVTLNSKGEYSEVVSATYTISEAKLGTPQVFPSPGTYTEQVDITITVPSGCTAYYSWDGSDPSTSGSQYTGPFPVINGSSVLSVVIKDNKGKTSPLFRGEYHYNP